jgi:aspartyl-tRNA(Asn)/glutamyl-tRNA(Gln) amidotransferase subunit A
LTCISEIPNDSSGLLQGVTVAVKDNICTTSMPTTCSSAMLSGQFFASSPTPCAKLIVTLPDFTSPFGATVVTRLQQSGAHMIGKTNCDEFGMG